MEKTSQEPMPPFPVIPGIFALLFLSGVFWFFFCVTGSDFYCFLHSGPRSAEPAKYKELNEFCALGDEDRKKLLQLMHTPKPNVPSPYYNQEEALEILKRSKAND